MPESSGAHLHFESTFWMAPKIRLNGKSFHSGFNKRLTKANLINDNLRRSQEIIENYLRVVILTRAMSIYGAQAAA